MQIHIESADHGGKHMVQFDIREANKIENRTSVFRKTGWYITVYKRVEGKTHFIPRQILFPFVNETLYLDSRSPFSVARIQRSGSNLCGSGNIFGSRWMKYDIMLTGVCIGRRQLYQSISNGVSNSGNLFGRLTPGGDHIFSIRQALVLCNPREPHDQSMRQTK